jgi:hypothetical protein
MMQKLQKRLANYVVLVYNNVGGMERASFQDKAYNFARFGLTHAYFF